MPAPRLVLDSSDRGLFSHKLRNLLGVQRPLMTVALFPPNSTATNLSFATYLSTLSHWRRAVRSSTNKTVTRPFLLRPFSQQTPSPQSVHLFRKPVCDIARLLDKIRVGIPAEQTTMGVVHEPELSRFSLKIDDIEEPATLRYTEEDIDGVKILNMYSTFVPEAMRGQGIAGKLVKFGCAFARENRYKIIPTCTYIPVYLKKHSDDLDVVYE